MVPPILHQGRSLTLRRTAPVDAPLLFEKMYSNLEFMHQFRLNIKYDSVSSLRETLANNLETAPVTSGYLEMLMIHKEYGAIGITLLSDLSEGHRRAEFAIGLFDPKHRFTSYALEGSLLIGDLAFNRYKFERVYTYVYGYNTHSQKSTLEGGFQLDGILRHHIYNSATNTFVDLYNFGMILEDFRNNKRLARLSKRLVGRDITQPLIQPISLPQPPSTDHPQFVRSGQMILNF